LRHANAKKELTHNYFARQRTWAALEELCEKDGIEYEYISIDPYYKGPNGEDTKNPLPLEEKRRRYPGFIEASPRYV
jgi:hypothetical protein